MPVIFILHLQSQPPGLEDQHAAVHVPGPRPAEPRAWHCAECGVPRGVATAVPALISAE